MPDALWVYLAHQRVARLDHDAGQLTLRYESSATAPLSVRLPVRQEPYIDSECRPFFTNLLPEGSWRDALARQLGVSPEDDFGLLSAIGADCAGAVALRTEPDWTPASARYVETSEQQLAKWMKNPAARPQLKTTPGLRLSLAGAQDKLLIHVDREKPYLCEGGAPSTVILKPDILDPFNQVELSALNELLSMRLAANVLNSVPRTFWFASGFAVERFDRERRADGRLARLHQEDFAQVLGLPSRAKYSVTWRDCFEIATRYTSTPARARVELTDRLLFSLVLGNNDAHGKNFALLYVSTDQTVLSPAYDLVSTELYPSLSRNMAMPIAGAVSLGQLDSDTWKAFASEVGIGQQFLRERGNELVESVSTALDGLMEVERAHPALRDDIYPARRRHQLFTRFRNVVEANCRQVAASLR